MNPITILNSRKRYSSLIFMSFSFILFVSFLYSLLPIESINPNISLPVTITASAHPAVAQFEQCGEDISGERRLENAGWSSDLSFDGKTLIVGSRYAREVAPQELWVPGRAYVYRWTGGTWGNPILEWTGDENNQEDRVGEAVAISGNGRFVAIGAPGIDNRKGKVRIYDLQNLGSGYIDELIGTIESAEFGNALALSFDGTRLVVGARRDNTSGFVKGAVRVYQKDANSGSYSQLGNTILGQRSLTGWSVDISGNGQRIVVGACVGQGSSAELGATRIYEFSCEEEWDPVGPEIIEEQIGWGNAYSVSTTFDGCRVAIGERLHNNRAGRVLVYDEADEIWTATAAVPAPGIADSEFGFSVSLNNDGTKLAVGERVYDDPTNGINAGRTTVFSWSGTSWTETGNQTGDSHHVLSGRSVSISGSGEFVAIGEPRNAWGGDFHFIGRVRVFRVQ